MEITIDSIIGILGLLFGGGAVGGIFTWRWQRAKAKTEAKSAEVDMAQKVQDTYQQILDDKQKEVEDNHRLIAELREDRDHYKKGYAEFRDQVDQLQKEFREFKNSTEDERNKMKSDIARYGRILECMRPSLCGRDGCAIRVPVTISPSGEIETTLRPTQQKPQHDSQDISYIDPYHKE